MKPLFQKRSIKASGDLSILSDFLGREVLQENKAICGLVMRVCIYV